MTNRVRVVVADDHAPTRQLVGEALEHGGFEVCAMVRDAPSAVRAVVDERADIALLDVNMPGGGVAAAGELARLRPGVAVVMLTVSSDDNDLLAAIAAGAVGYILKGVSGDELVRSLRSVLAGESVLPAVLVRTLLGAFRDQAQSSRLTQSVPRTASLSDREREVLQLLELDLTTAQMAARLFVSPATVRSHIAAILRKLQVPDRGSAVRLIRGHPKA